jgi:hypothetical protein
MPTVVAYLVMVNQLEIELKLESNYVLFVAFRQNNPLAKIPYMYRGLVILHHQMIKSS